MTGALGLEAVESAGASRRPLSFGQEQLWFLDQLSPAEPSYNIPVRYRLTGELDVTLLTEALRRVVERHQVLRATFGSVDGSPYQVFGPVAEPVLPVTDVAGQRDPAAEADEIARREATTPFDLALGPLHRFRLIRLGLTEHVLCVTVHHSVCDGWSMGVLNREVSETYRALLAGAEPALPELRVGYADYVGWQRERLRGRLLERPLDYWQRQLADLPVLELPTDRSRPAVFSYRGATVVRTVPAGLADGLRELARDTGTSLLMVLSAAFTAVLGRHARQEDVPVGTTMLGRSEPELEDLVGLFVNMVVLRADLSGAPTVTELLARLRDVTLAAYEHQDVPFEKVVERVQPARDPSRNPLFQACLQLLGDGTSGGDVVLPGVTVEPLVTTTERSRFDLGLIFVESPAGLRVQAEYATDIFDRWRVEQLLAHLERMLAGMVADRSARVWDIPLTTAAERAELVELGTGPVAPVRDVPLHAVVAQHARAHPDAPAAVFADTVLSYAELDRQADRLARHLRALGVRPGEIVAVALDRGLDAWVSLLGVLKAGAAYVVLDIANPPARLAFILTDAGSRFVLTSSAVRPTLPEPAGWTPIELDRERAAIAAHPDTEPLQEWATGDSMAYVLYTSGSTGKPKGVLIEHRALDAFVAGFRETFPVGPGDRMLQFASLSFDLSQGEIFSAWLSGAALVSAPREVLTSPEGLAELIRRERVTYIGPAPAMLGLVEPEPYPDLKYLLVGGESFPGELVNRWNLAGRTFVNGYGPTEAAVGCVFHPCEHVTWQSSPPIGRPLTHRRIYVVDGRDRLQPVGVPGELLIGGDEGLARGYLNQPELTAERFVPDPFRDTGRVYRSGDLVRWNPDGRIEFLGRIDGQVKLRGLRIELEEIEAVLVTHPRVAQAAVLLREDTPGAQRLVGYVTSVGDRPTVEELAAHVGEQVPAYMVPTAWVFLEAMPLSLAGKVDRRALPAPAAEGPQRSAVPVDGELEHRIADVFAEILVQDGIGAEDDFFLLGGNSLQAMRVVSRLNRALDLDLNVRTLYSAPTVRALAGQVEAAVDPAGPRLGAATATWVPPEEVRPDERMAAAVLTEVVGPPPPGRPDAGAYDRGADEAALDRVLALLGERAGVPLSRRDIVRPSVLAAAVAAASREHRRRFSPGLDALFPLRTGTSGVQLFCAPAVSGSAASYSAMARLLPGHPTVLAAEPPGLQDDRPPLESIEDLATYYLVALRGVPRSGPRVLLGWSMGGLVALDMARQLAAAGDPVDTVICVDSSAPVGEPMPSEAEVAAKFVTDLAGIAMRPEAGADWVDPGLDEDRVPVLLAYLRATGLLPGDLADEDFRRRYGVLRANVRSTTAYRPDWTFPGRLVVLRAERSPEELALWHRFGAHVEQHVLPGDHYTIWLPEHLPTLTRVLGEELRSAAHSTEEAIA